MDLDADILLADFCQRRFAVLMGCGSRVAFKSNLSNLRFALLAVSSLESQSILVVFFFILRYRKIISLVYSGLLFKNI